ncbi:unnamed protein product [Closterium sp. NIES-54]
MSFAWVFVLVRHFFGKLHTQHRCFSRLDDAWRAEFGDDVELPRWADLFRSRVAIFDLDFDAILSAMYALSVSAKGDCYRCVPPDPDIADAALGASESGTLPGTAPAQALQNFTLDLGASRCFFRDSTTLTPLPAPVPVRLADPSWGPFVARSSTVLPCLAVPSGSLSGLHLPSFSTSLVSTAALQDAMVTTTTLGGQPVSICMFKRMGRHLATFTHRPGSSLYTLATEPPQGTASAQVSASGQVAASCSCRLLLHRTLLWHHRLGHPSLPRLRGMHSCLLVSGLPRSLPPLPPSRAPPYLPCVEGWQCTAPQSSSISPTTAPLQTLHMDVWGPACVSGQSRERYFLLVVDDYTRYTTVFPLRSKGEVVDVLIPWISTVRLQLRERFSQDLLILCLHSDRGGEFSSNLLRDFCRGEGILLSFTLPDSPQQNGTAERRIGLVMEVARTSMIHAAAPHFLWPFAGVDYFQTFFPTPKMTTLPMLLHVAAQRDYKLHSLDFSTAFLQGSLCRSPGFTGLFPAGTQWSLRRPVFGLHQAPRQWHDTLRTTLAALGFAPSTADPSLFLRTNTSLLAFYVLVYVDDHVFATPDTKALILVKSQLQKRHTCTNLGELHSYLGLQVTRDRARRTITLTQSHMMHQVLQRFGFTYSSPQSTPLLTSHSLSAPPSNESVEPSGLYPELVGCLMYLMTCTRPDLACPLSILARYLVPGRHGPEYWEAAKRVLRYLCSTSGMGLVLGGRVLVFLTGHVNASWVDDLATQRSSQGYTFSLSSGSISWRSTRSSSVLSSSCEAEIYAGAMAAQELRWLTYLPTDLGEWPCSSPVLYVDNKAMIALCQEHRLEHRTKHIALRYFVLRTTVAPSSCRGPLTHAVRSQFVGFVVTHHTPSGVRRGATDGHAFCAAAQRGGFGGSQRQQQLRSRETPSVQQLREWYAGRGRSGGAGPCTYVFRTGSHRGEACGLPHTTQCCFGCLTDAWRTQFPGAVELPRWHDLLLQNVPIFDLDFDAILAAMYAFADSAEGDCYLSVPPDPGIATAALGASVSAAPGTGVYDALGAGASALSGIAPIEALHTFTLDSGASRYFFRGSNTLTPLIRPVAVSLADPSKGQVLAHSSTVLPCPAAPSGFLSRLHLPSFSTNLVSGADLQDVWVDQFTPGGQRVTHCTCSRTGCHLATFTRRPGSSLYTLTTAPPPVSASVQVAASSQVFAAASKSSPASAPCSCRPLLHETLLWHHCLGHPSLPRLRGMASRALGHERYFLLVVDDYSRYTTVFPLRSKGEVPEGIRQMFTLPASPQQNGIAERRVGMVMDVARTSMIHATAPLFLWPFAVQYVAHQINLQPRVSLPETTPTLRWTGKVGDVSVFRVWGSRAFVRDNTADKLSSRAVPCVFLGFPPDAPGWQFYHPTSRRVLSSQDVTFDESVFTSGMGLVLGGRARVVLPGHADASWELRWLTYLQTDLGEAPRSPPVLYVDNKAMLALCQEHRLEHITKHIALRYFLARKLQ